MKVYLETQKITIAIEVPLVQIMALIFVWLNLVASQQSTKPPAINRGLPISNGSLLNMWPTFDTIP